MKNLSIITALSLSCVFSAYAQSPIESGDAAYESGQYLEASQYYEQGLANSSDLHARLRLATCYYYMNRIDDAEAAYVLAARNPDINKSDVWVDCYFAAEVMKANGKYQEAANWYEKVARHQPNIAAEAFMNLEFAKKHRTDKSAYKVNLETGISTPSAEYAPTFYNNQLVYASSQSIEQPHLGGFSNPQEDNFLYVATPDANGRVKDGKLFQEETLEMTTKNMAPIAMIQTANGYAAISTFNSFSENFRHLHKTMGVLEMEIHSMDSKGKIGKGEPFMKSNASDGFPAFDPTQNGSVVYFASDRPGGQGGYDLYMTFYTTTGWSQPINLGPNVNTASDEIAPFVAKDGTLYFSSDFHKGFGGFDLYRANKSATGEWTEVRNLGTSINSSYDDVYFTYDEGRNLGYFSSNRKGGKGDFDIYSCQLVGDISMMPLVAGTVGTDPVVINNPPSPVNPGTGVGGTDPNMLPNASTVSTTVNPTDVVTPNPPAPPMGDPNAVVGNPSATVSGNIGATPKPEDLPCANDFYIGSVLDNNTKQPVAGVTVFIRNETTKEKSSVPTNDFGEYSVFLAPKSTYTIGLSKEGYMNTSFVVQTTGAKTILQQKYIKSLGEDDLFDPNTNDGFNPMPQPFSMGDPNAVAGDGTEEAVDYRYSTAQGKGAPKTVHFIQLGVFSQLDEEKKADLRRYGHIYTDEVNGKTRYRLGMYAVEDHAKELAAELDQAGYTGAYVISSERSNPGSLAAQFQSDTQILYPEGLGDAPTEVVGDPGNVVATEGPIIVEPNVGDWADNPGSTKTTPAVAQNGIVYKVQLGAYSKPENAAFDNLYDLGPIEQQKGSNGLTYFYIGGFSSVDSAKSARTKAEQRGAQSPFIVAFQDGQKIKLDDALNASAN